MLLLSRIDRRIIAGPCFATYKVIETILPYLFCFKRSVFLRNHRNVRVPVITALEVMRTMIMVESHSSPVCLANNRPLFRHLWRTSPTLRTRRNSHLRGRLYQIFRTFSVEFSLFCDRQVNISFAGYVHVYVGGARPCSDYRFSTNIITVMGLVFFYAKRLCFQ